MREHLASLTIDSGERAAFEARALVDALPTSLTMEQRYDIRLALSELVSNTVIHGNPRPHDPVEVRITVSDTSIRCEVSDQGAGFRTNDAPPSQSGGLGLVLVDRIAARWGTQRGGRSVWFELERAG